MSKGWEVHRVDLTHKVTGDEIVRVHGIPMDDLEQHVIDVGFDVTCHCDPTIEIQENDAWVVTHNAFDGRELYEQA